MKKAWLGLAVGVAVLGLFLFVWKFRPAWRPSGQPARHAAALPSDFDRLVKEAAALEAQGELLQAQEAYKALMTRFAGRSDMAELQKKWEGINMRVLLSALNVPEETTTYVVKEGDSLSAIGTRYNTTVAFIKKENGLASDIIRPNMRLRIWTGKFSVLVDKSQNLLSLQSNGELVRTYPVSTGKNNITPVGTFKIINKLTNPDWTHEGKVIPFGNPENILGTRWMGFDVPGYGIHGTSQPETIGQQATAGCVRMLNSDVEELYDLLPNGTEVIITD